MELHRSKSESASHEQVTLNVGGQLFRTTLQTLLRDNTYFPEHRHALTKTTLFIDRNPDAFVQILDLLRGYPLDLESLSAALRTKVQADLVYYGIAKKI
jgi:hypothetical protein